MPGSRHKQYQNKGIKLSEACIESISKMTYTTSEKELSHNPDRIDPNGRLNKQGEVAR